MVLQKDLCFGRFKAPTEELSHQALYAPQRSPPGTWATGGKGQEPCGSPSLSFLPSFLPVSRSVDRAPTMWSELTLLPQSPFLQHSYLTLSPMTYKYQILHLQSCPVLERGPKPSPGVSFRFARFPKLPYLGSSPVASSGLRTLSPSLTSSQKPGSQVVAA